MKKIRITIFAITIVLAIAIATGIIVQISLPNSTLDSTYEIIAFLISGVSIVFALLSQISSYRERKEYSKIIHELNEVISENKTEIAMDKKAFQKLDELIALDHRIYGRITEQAKRKAKK